MMLYPSHGNLILERETDSDKETAMGQFENVLAETLVITTRVGIPLVILFLIGYIIRIWHPHS